MWVKGHATSFTSAVIAASSGDEKILPSEDSWALTKPDALFDSDFE